MQLFLYFAFPWTESPTPHPPASSTNCLGPRPVPGVEVFLTGVQSRRLCQRPSTLVCRHITQWLNVKNPDSPAMLRLEDAEL